MSTHHLPSPVGEPHFSPGDELNFSPAGEPHFSLEGLRLLDTGIVGAQEEVPPLIDMDGVTIFVMVASLLFVAQLGKYSAILFTLSVIIHVLRHRGALREMFGTEGFFLLFPAYAILSSIWSWMPVDTLKHSLEFLLTVVAALLMVQVQNRRSLMFALFVSFAAYSVALLWSGSLAEADAPALSGFIANRNEEAAIVATGAIIALAWLFLGFRTRRYFQSVLALAVLAVEIYAALLAGSNGALTTLAVGLVAFLLFCALAKTGRRLRLVLVGFGGVGALSLAMIFLVFTGPIIDALSGWFGKDITLMGRTYLWSRASDLIAEQPILGRGFAGFWQQGNLDAEGLSQFARLTGRSGFNFHNTSYDILVSLGWVGLILFTLTLIVGLVKMASVYVSKPSLLTAFWLAMAAALVVRMPIETLGTYEFSFTTILLFAIFGYAVKQKEHNERQARQAWQAVWEALPLLRGLDVAPKWRAPQ